MGEAIPIRCATVVIDKGKVLLVKSRYPDEEGEFYLFPGGGLEDDESAIECAKRETLEETGCDVTVSNNIVHCNEYVKNNHDNFKSIVLFFKATLNRENVVERCDDNGKITDVVWMDYSEFKNSDVRPICLKFQVMKALESGNSLYDCFYSSEELIVHD